jgi:hypothetical protein
LSQSTSKKPVSEDGSRPLGGWPGIKPSQCVLGFGVPIDYESFRKAKASPASHDFVVNLCSNWAEYYRYIAKHIEIQMPRLRTLGVRICEALTLAEFGEQLVRKDTRVLIVFSHFTDAEIEFADGLASLPNIISRIPIHYDGVLDLCVCHPTRLIPTLEVQRPLCLKKFVDLPVRPAFWIHVYRVLFETLNSSPCDYLSALERAISALSRGHGNNRLDSVKNLSLCKD